MLRDLAQSRKPGASSGTSAKKKRRQWASVRKRRLLLCPMELPNMSRSIFQSLSLGSALLSQSEQPSAQDSNTSECSKLQALMLERINQLLTEHGAKHPVRVMGMP